VIEIITHPKIYAVSVYLFKLIKIIGIDLFFNLFRTVEMSRRRKAKTRSINK
jgi:hypothetical protein